MDFSQDFTLIHTLAPMYRVTYYLSMIKDDNMPTEPDSKWNRYLLANMYDKDTCCWYLFNGTATSESGGWFFHTIVVVCFISTRYWSKLLLNVWPTSPASWLWYKIKFLGQDKNKIFAFYGKLVVQSACVLNILNNIKGDNGQLVLDISCS